MWTLDEARMRELKSYGIENFRLTTLHNQAREHLDEAADARPELRHDPGLASAALREEHQALAVLEPGRHLGQRVHALPGQLLQVAEEKGLVPGSPGGAWHTGRIYGQTGVCLVGGGDPGQCQSYEVVGGDTGPVHLSASLSVPTLAVFLASDRRRNGPLGAHVAVVSGAADTSAGPTGSARSRPIRAVAADEITAAVRDLLDACPEP